MPKKQPAAKKSTTTKKKKKSASKTGPTLAERADRFDLYQISVQSPSVDVEFFDAEFKRLRGRQPMHLREDFCGTALLSTHWCMSHPKRTAVGVDLDGDTLAWGQKHNVDPAGPGVASRVKLVKGDVRTGRAKRVDLVLAMNFSYCVFHTRPELGKYFEAAYHGLSDRGIFALEVYGGTESMGELVEERELRRKGVTYIWEQEKFNPIDHRTLCHISWRFADRSELKRAFTYDWRLWTLPELKELLLAAGFKEVKFYFERVDGDEDDEYLTGTGEFVEHHHIDNQEAWLAYVVALK